MKFRLAAAASILYMLFARCGFDPWKYLKAKDFKDIPDFNTQKIIRILGAAISESSEQVLRTIAVTIYNHEYQGQPTQDISRPVQPQNNDSDGQTSTASVQNQDETRVGAVEDNANEPEPDTAQTAEPKNSIQNNPETEPASHKLQPVYYQAGDTVCIEDTLYKITDIGLFDVQLCDPSLSYPVYRSENKERFESMLKHNIAKLVIDADDRPSSNSEVRELPAPAATNFCITDEHVGEGALKQSSVRI